MITINVEGNSDFFIETEYPPLYFMAQSGKTLTVPIASQAEGSRRALESSSSTVVTFKKFKLTYISGALSNSSVEKVPSTEPPTDYD